MSRCFAVSPVVVGDVVVSLLAATGGSDSAEDEKHERVESSLGHLWMRDGDVERQRTIQIADVVDAKTVHADLVHVGDLRSRSS